MIYNIMSKIIKILKKICVFTCQCRTICDVEIHTPNAEPLPPPVLTPTHTPTQSPLNSPAAFRRSPMPPPRNNLYVTLT